VAGADYIVTEFFLIYIVRNIPVHYCVLRSTVKRMTPFIYGQEACSVTNACNKDAKREDWGISGVGDVEN